MKTSSTAKRKKPAKEFSLSAFQFEQLYAIFNSINDIVFCLSVEGVAKYRFTYINEAFLKATGLQKRQVINKFAHNVIPAASHELVLGNYNKVVRNKKPISWEENSTYPGGLKVAAVTITPWLDESGNCTKLIGTVQDFTQLRGYESVMAENAEWFRTAFEQSASGMCITGIDGILLKANQPLCEMLGYGLQELEGKHFNFITHPDDRNIGSELLEKLLDGIIEKATVEKRYMHKAGHPVWVHINSAIVKHNTKAPHYLIVQVEEISSRKTAEEKIRASESKFQTLLERVSDAFVALDKNWNYVYANKRAGEVTGKDSESLIGNHMLAMFPDIQNHDFYRAYKRAMETQKYEYIEHYYPPNGKWYENHIYPSPDGLSIFFRDITERIKARQEIILEKELSERIINTLPGIFYLYNIERKFLRWNRNFELVTGYTGEEISKMNPLDFFEGDEKELLRQKIENVFSVGSDQVEANFLLKNNEKIPYYFTGIVTVYQGQTCLMGVGIDIAERKRAEALLQKSNAQLLSAQQIAHLGYWEWNLKNDSIYWSDEMYTICGFSLKNRAINKESFLNMVHLDDSRTLDEKFTEAIKENQSGEVEFRFIRGDGAIRNVVATISKVTDKTGETICLEGTLQDITQQKNHLKAIQEQNNKLREIAWLQSHVVRAPLARIMGLIYCINLEGIQAQEMKEILGHILASAKELDGIVREIVNKTEEIENQPKYELKRVK